MEKPSSPVTEPALKPCPFCGCDAEEEHYQIARGRESMMNFDTAFRTAKLQELVRWGTLEAMKEDGHHKSSEAYMEIGYCLPGMFSDDQNPYWQVQIYSYVLGPSRMHSWTGKSLDEALALAEAAVEEWTQEYKFKAMDREMSKMIEPEGDIEDTIPEPPAAK